MRNVIACIDGSTISTSVCDAASWAASTMETQLLLLHTLEKQLTPVNDDFSGAIGLGSREHLLDELIALDIKRSKIALEHGKEMLADATLRAKKNAEKNNQRLNADDFDVVSSQRHGSLIESLQDLEANARLVVMGRLGEANTSPIGSQVENVIRALDTPILMTVGEFSVPKKFMLAFDGEESSKSAIERIAASPLLKGVECHLVMVSDEQDKAAQISIEQAKDILAEQGFDAITRVLSGDVQTALDSYHAEQEIDLLVMGAYRHSRFHQFFFGGNSSRLIAGSNIPLLILK